MKRRTGLTAREIRERRAARLAAGGHGAAAGSATETPPAGVRRAVEPARAREAVEPLRDPEPPAAPIGIELDVPEAIEIDVPRAQPRTDRSRTAPDLLDLGAVELRPARRPPGVLVAALLELGTGLAIAALLARAVFVASTELGDLGKGAAKLALLVLWVALTQMLIGWRLLRGDGGGRWRHVVATLLVVPVALLVALGLRSVWSVVPLVLAVAWAVSPALLFTAGATRFFDAGPRR